MTTKAHHTAPQILPWAHLASGLSNAEEREVSGDWNDLPTPDQPGPLSHRGNRSIA